MKLKYIISKKLAANCKLNKTALKLKRSWDSVEKYLNGNSSSGKKRKT